MILPTKYLPAERSLIAIGGEVLVSLREHPLTVSEAWEALSTSPRKHPLDFDWYALALALLFAIGLVELADGRLHLRRPS